MTELTPATIFAELAGIVGSIKAAGIEDLIVAFQKHDVIGEIQGCSTLAEAILKIIAIFVPGASAVELGVETTAFIAITIMRLEGSPFKFTIPQVTTDTEENIEDQLGPSHGGRGY